MQALDFTLSEMGSHGMLLRTEDLALIDQRERASRAAEPTKGLVINGTEPQMSLIRDPVFRWRWSEEGMDTQ